MSSTPSEATPVAIETPTTTEPKPLSNSPIGPDGKPLRMCCVCPETKVPRDECVLLKGEENCKTEIDAHKACLRALGFNI